MIATRLRHAVLLLSLLATPVGAEPLGVGDALPPVTLEDQHEVEHRVDASVSLILFSRDMDGGGVIRALLDPESLGEAPAGFLERHGAVCVADVHRMPGLIRRAIAKPRMRKRPYPLLLDESGEATAAWPSADEQATLLRLREGRLVEVAHFADPAALRAALATPSAP